MTIAPSGRQSAESSTKTESGKSSKGSSTVTVAPVDPVRDRTGAGDGFLAGFLSSRRLGADPVSAATSTRGRLIYGAGIGLLIYVIRTWGAYPDGVAFAVLLMNMAVPAIDYMTRPHIVGHADGSDEHG